MGRCHDVNDRCCRSAAMVVAAADIVKFVVVSVPVPVVAPGLMAFVLVAEGDDTDGDDMDDDIAVDHLDAVSPVVAVMTVAAFFVEAVGVVVHVLVVGAVAVVALVVVFEELHVYGKRLQPSPVWLLNQ